MSKSLGFWLSVSMALLPIVAQADTGLGHFVVSVNVIAQCRITMPGISNNASSVLRDPLVNSEAVALNCSRNTAYEISFSSGVKSDNTKRFASITGLGNGATQTISIDNYPEIRSSIIDHAQVKTLVMTINY
ncbi:MAG: hypothetical protein WBR29_12435 [Gammaproteobacteria bacterium]